MEGHRQWYAEIHRQKDNTNKQEDQHLVELRLLSGETQN